MTDNQPAPTPRPAPEYGEYATPQQQAAAMGREYVAPAPPSVIAPPAAARPEVQPIGMGHLVDRFVTTVLLGIGLLTLITSDWFQFAVNTNLALAEAGVATRIPTAVDRYGWVLLGANILFLALTFLWTYSALRRGRWAFYIPVVGNFAFTIAAGIFTYAVAR